MIAGLSLANFHGGQQSAEIRLASELLVTQIRSVQTSSYGGRLVPICAGGANAGAVCESGKTQAVNCPSSTCQDQVPKGYGLHFNAGPSKTYTLFYDTDDDKRYAPKEKIFDVSFISTGAVEMTASSVGLPQDLVYTPPYGQLFVNGAATGAPILVTLTLYHPNGNLTRHVNVFRLSGKVEHD